jgi:transcriptional regulator with XRE-family HTH domain
MAILRSRDELLPVTCAVLKDEVREKFFSNLKKKVGGKMERVAKVCGTSLSNVNGWEKGDPTPPYTSLQLIASEFGLEMPEVSELRREFRAVEEASKGRRPATKQKPSDFGPSPKKQEEKKQAEHPKQESHNKNSRKPERRPENKPAATTPNTATSPDKLTVERSYWTGVLLARGRRDQTHIRLIADRQMSQNFAATWSNLTHQAFGARPELTMSADRTEQTASLPAEKVAAFLERIDFPPDVKEAPGAPRWTWSKAGYPKHFSDRRKKC